MLDLAFTQPLQNRPLSGLTLVPERIVHIATLFVLCRQSCRSTKIGLVGEHHQKFRLLTVRRMFRDPGRNLGPARSLFKRVALTGSTRRAERRHRCYGSCCDEQ